MNSPNAAAADAADSLGHLVMNVAGTELRPERQRVFAFVEPACDSALAFVEPTTENDVHLKSFRERCVWWCRNLSNTANHRRISSFFIRTQRLRQKGSLVQGLDMTHATLE